MSLIKLEKVPVIVLAFANERTHPDGFLTNLTAEMKAILQVMEPAIQRGKVFLKILPGVTADDIAKAFQDGWYDDRICIFHYAGHADDDELLLQKDGEGNRSFFSSGLAKFLGAQKSLKLVFLNGCATKDHSRLLHEANIPAVISTSYKINDGMAREFATLFYRGIAGGESIEDSYREAEGVLEGLYRDELKTGSNTRSLIWDEDEEASAGPLPEFDHPWRLTFREQADWVPAQWRLFYELGEEVEGGPSDDELLVGQMINNYQILEFLGQGTMGKVFRVLHTGLNEERAIKITHKVAKGYDQLRTLVLAGNKGMSTIQHPNVVRFFDVGEEEVAPDDFRLYMVMELIKGERLDKLDYSIYWSDKKDIPRLRDLMIQLFSGLAAAHEVSFEDNSGMPREGIIHGNIKARKILFTTEGVPKLIDFLFTDLTRSPAIQLVWPEEIKQRARNENPEAYLAPELRKGKTGPNRKTDIFALGAVCFELLTKQDATMLPFGSYQELQNFVRQHNAIVPKSLIQVIWNATHPKPNLRYTSASSVVEDVLKTLSWRKRMGVKIRQSSNPVLNLIGNMLPQSD